MADLSYVFISGAALLISILGEWFIAILPGIETWNRHFFQRYFFVLMLVCLSAGIEIVFYYYPNPGSARVSVWNPCSSR